MNNPALPTKIRMTAYEWVKIEKTFRMVESPHWSPERIQNLIRIAALKALSRQTSDYQQARSAAETRLQKFNRIYEALSKSTNQPLMSWKTSSKTAKRKTKAPAVFKWQILFYKTVKRKALSIEIIQPMPKIETLKCTFRFIMEASKICFHLLTYRQTSCSAQALSSTCAKLRLSRIEEKWLKLLSPGIAPFRKMMRERILKRAEVSIVRTLGRSDQELIVGTDLLLANRLPQRI